MVAVADGRRNHTGEANLCNYTTTQHKSFYMTEVQVGIPVPTTFLKMKNDASIVSPL